MNGLCLVFVLVQLACIHAQSVPPDHRNLQMTVSQNQLFVLANYQNGSFSDQYQLNMYINQNQRKLADFVFQYQAQSGPNQTQMQMQIGFNSIIEYNSSDSRLNYYANDSFVSRYPENNQVANWRPYVNETTIVDGVPVYVYQWTTSDGVVTIRVHLAPRTASTSTGTLTPNDVKIDIEIHEYPFLGDQTRLAVHTNVQSQTQSQNTGSQALQNNNFLFLNEDSTGFPFGYFSWEPLAAGNGTVNVVATCAVTNYGNQFDVFFSFLTDPKSIHSDIVWDPKMGLSYSQPSSNSPHFCLGSVCGAGGVVLVVFIVLAVVIVVGVVAFLFLRKRDSYEPIQS